MYINPEMFIARLRKTGYANKDFVDFIRNSSFFDAPASTTLSFHGCYPGGLADHSDAVADYVVEHNGDQLDVFCALVHDVCKYDIYDKLPEQKESNGRIYLYDTPQEKKQEGHGSKSIRILHRFNIYLPFDAEQAIAWHMGQWTHDMDDSVENEQDNKKHFDELKSTNKRLSLLSDADMYASHVLGR